MLKKAMLKFTNICCGAVNFLTMSSNWKIPRQSTSDILKAFPGEKQLADAIFRLVIYYPREWDRADRRERHPPPCRKRF